MSKVKSYKKALHNKQMTNPHSVIIPNSHLATSDPIYHLINTFMSSIGVYKESFLSFV